MASHLEHIGKQVGDYRLLNWLGGGGFGNVYLAEHIRDHSLVATKLLNIRLSHGEALKAFINEARTIRLKHAHIVPLLDFGISRDDVPFLVMEYMAQGTLREQHPQGSRLPLPLVVKYAQQVASALQYAHEQRLVHRDVKPENMLLRIDGTVLLSDFGVVAVMYNSSTLSQQREIGGTTAYMAPEQIRGKAQAASDQYSLGIVVYEWITGQRPFEGTATELAMQHAIKPPPSLLAEIPTLERAIEEVILKALAKDPKDRFETVQDFTVALEQAVGSTPPTSDEYDTPPIRNNRQALLPSTNISPVSSLAPVSLSGPRTKPVPRVDWGDALTIPTLYGREQEQIQLTQWVVQEHYHVVSVLGIGGIGKSALVMSMAYRLAEHFEVVIVRSLRDTPSCEEFVEDCLQSLGQTQESGANPPLQPATLEQRIGLLLERLRNVRVLIVLDNLESLLEVGDIRGHFRPGFEGYGQLLHRVAETAHQSCLLLTSREKPAELRLLEGKYSLVRSLHLIGLDTTACKQLLVEKGIALGFTPGVGTEEEAKSLIELYGGNPLALKIVAETIIDLFGGEIGPFLAGRMVIFGSITDLLDEQFARLSATEQSVLFWLAIMRESVTLNELLAMQVSPMSSVQMLKALDAGYQRSLVERGKRPGSFTLQSVVLEYVTTVLITKATSEILQGQLDIIIQYSLEGAYAREYVRQTQERLLLSPLLTDLQRAYRGRADETTVKAQLLSLLNQLRTWPDTAQGYGPANLIALLRQQQGNLNGLDLSKLCIRGASLQGIEMQEASLSGSLISNSVFTEAVSATRCVAISPDGSLWAAGGMQGKIRIWDEGGQTLQRIWQAHTDTVQTLAFSPDGCSLASGSMDGTIKLWDMSHKTYPGDTPLWTGRHNNIILNLAFSPDSSLLASCGMDSTVRLWDPQSGINLQTLTHAGHVATIAWSPDSSLLVSGCFDGEIRLWQRQKTEPPTCVECIISVKTNQAVTSLTFAPYGRTLACSNWDGMLTLWEARTLRQLHTFPKHRDMGKRIAWSPDGRVLASYSHSRTIWLWDIEQDCYRAALLGHTDDIHALTFTPDSLHLLSSSEDGTLRVWDVQRGQCLRVITGYAVSLYDIDWSPDSTQLVSGSSDGLVTIWDIRGTSLPKVLRGHRWVVYGVGWSPNGRFLASCGWDTTIRLWDTASLSSFQIFEDSSTILLGVAWSQNGSMLACGTYLRGVQVWDMTTRRLRWVGEPHQTAFSCVAWSPDGTRLAGGSDEGNVYLWEGADSTEQAEDPVPTKIPAHRGQVTSIAWSPDGTQLASSGGRGGSGELFVWDVKTGEHLHTFAQHSGAVRALAWSPGPRDARHNPCRDYLISGGSDGILRWWDVQSGECVRRQKAHQSTIKSLKVSPDEKWLASCGDDGAIMIWDLVCREGFYAPPSLVRTLQPDRPYERLNITGIRGLTEAQKVTLQALGAMEEMAP